MKRYDFTPTLWQSNKTEQIITIQVPSDTRWDPDLAQHFMTTLFALPSSVTLRIGSTSRQIVWQIVTPVGSATSIKKTLYALYPNTNIQVSNKYGYEFGRDTILPPLRYEFELGEPFVVPLNYASDFKAIDPLTALIGAMTNLGSNEAIVYELILKPASAEHYKMGQEFVTASRIGVWNFLSMEGLAFAAFLRLNNLHRRPKYAPTIQRVLESKLNTTLKEATLNLRFYGTNSHRAGNLVQLFRPPLATFSREGFNYLVPAQKEAFPLVLSAPETAALWHLPTVDCQVPGIQWAPQRSSPLPQSMAANKGGVLLGENIYQNKRRNVILPFRDRSTHALLIGKTRTGKSTLLHHIIHQDIAAGKGVGVIDPHGQLVDNILESSIPPGREKDVVLFDINDQDFPIGLNMLSFDNDSSVGVVSSQILAIIRKMFADSWSSTRMEDALYAALVAALSLETATIQTIPKLFLDTSFRARVLKSVTDPVALEFWYHEFEPLTASHQREFARPITNRLRKFYRNDAIRPVICQKSCLDFRAIIDEGKIFLAKLGGIAEIDGETLGALLISKFQLAAMSRGSRFTDKLAEYYLHVDEVQNFVTTSLDKMFSEAGKYGLRLVVANQFLKQLEGNTLEAVMGNTGTSIFFRVGPQDARAFASFVKPQHTSEDLINLDRFKTVVKMQLHGETMPAFSMRTIKPIQLPENAAQRKKAIYAQSRARYARPRKEVEAELLTQIGNSISNRLQKKVMRGVILAEKYLPSYKRVEHPPPMRLTQRDKQIILAVYEYRLLTSPQVEVLFFQSDKPRGRQTSCQRRLQLLFHHGFLDRLLLPVVLGEGRAPYVYVLDEAGADLVAAELGINRGNVQWKPKNNRVGHQFVYHSQVVNDFRVAINLLQQSSHFTINEWIGEAEFRTRALQNRVPFRLRGARIIRNYPDGYFHLTLPHTSQAAHFFLEIDQGTMGNQNWQSKIEAYREFRSRGLSDIHFGTRNFRLLTVTTSEKRLENILRATVKAGGDFLLVHYAK